MPALAVDDVLATTRAVRRRLDLDRPVERAVLEDCLRLAIQAPSGGNAIVTHFVVVTEPDRRAALADIYRSCFERYRTGGHYPTDEVTTDRKRRALQARVARSAEYLAENIHRVPVHVVPCIQGRPPSDTTKLPGYFASVFPAVWSFMLAARSRRLGTCWTTMHLSEEAAAADILGIPLASMTQVALIPTAYTVGADFKPAPRPPVDQFVSWERWTAS